MKLICMSVVLLLLLLFFQCVPGYLSMVLPHLHPRTAGVDSSRRGGWMDELWVTKLKPAFILRTTADSRDTSSWLYLLGVDVKNNIKNHSMSAQLAKCFNFYRESVCLTRAVTAACLFHPPHLTDAPWLSKGWIPPVSRLHGTEEPPKSTVNTCVDLGSGRLLRKQCHGWTLLDTLSPSLSLT